METLVIALVILGAILSFLTLFIFIRNLEAAIFWAILLGPSLGNSLGGLIINLVAGKPTEAAASLRFLPAFLSAIDFAFFDLTADSNLVAVGLVLLFLWTYIIVHFTMRKMKIWGLPMIVPLLYVAGLTFPNLRMRLSPLPIIGPLASIGAGLPLLTLITSITLIITMLIVRYTKKESIAIPFPKRLTERGEPSEQ